MLLEELFEDNQFLKSKEEITDFLNANYIEDYIINDDLTVDVEGFLTITVTFKRRGLPLQFDTVDNNVDFKSIDLYSLKGSPREIGGDFDCSYNYLNELKFAPKAVAGDFLVNDNNLISLKGAPKEVPGDFVCNTNKLTSLEYGPREVLGIYDCSDNNITTLKGSPNIVNDFNCSYNKLKDLSTAPKTIKGDLIVVGMFKTKPDISHIDLTGNLFWQESDESDRFFESAQADYDLKSNYNKFNRELFNNELPDDLKIIWNNSKNSGASFNFQVNSVTKEFVRADNISISRALSSSYDELNGLIIHEMIHAYLTIVKGKHWKKDSESHGPEFTSILKDLNTKVDFEIPRTENITHKKVSAHIKEKKLGAVLLEKTDGSYSFSLYTMNTINEKFTSIVQLYNRYLENTSLYKQISIGVIETNLYAKYPVQRAIKKLKSWKVKDEELEHLKTSFNNAFGITHLDKD